MSQPATRHHYRLVLETLEERSLLATTSLGSTTPAQFSTALYDHLLQRQPAASEIEIWSLALQNGSTPGQIARSFVDSNEFRGNEITQAYQHYLRRNPEPGAVNLWTAQMQAGLSYQSFVADVLSSDEYLQDHGGASVDWITGIYHDLLGRDPDRAGLDAWSQDLSQGLAPTAIAQRFMYSPENLSLQITAAYHDFLSRSPDTGGLANWVGAMETGLSLEQLTVLFESSPEFIANQIVISPPMFTADGQTALGSAATLVVPGFSSTSTPAIAVDINPANFSGQVFIDVDLNHNGSFSDPGENGQTSGTITPQNHQLTLSSLPNGTFAIRARVDGPSGQVVSPTVTVTVNTNEGFIGANDLLNLYNDFATDLKTTGTLPADFFKTSAHVENFDAQERVGLNIHATLPQYLPGLAADLTSLGMAISQVYAPQQMVIGYLPVATIAQLTTLPNFGSVDADLRSRLPHRFGGEPRRRGHPRSRLSFAARGRRHRRYRGRAFRFRQRFQGGTPGFLQFR